MSLYSTPPDKPDGGGELSLCEVSDERGQANGSDTSRSLGAPRITSAIVEFDLVGNTARGPFRQAMVYLLRIRDGRVLLLREFVDTAALSELFQVGAPTD